MDKDNKTSHRFRFPHLRLTVLATAVAAVAGLGLVSSISLAQSGSARSSDISSSIANQQVDLEKSRSEVTVLDLDIATAEQYLDHNRMDLADANSRLGHAEDQYNATLRMFEGRLAAIYKLGDDNAYAVIFSSDSFSDAISRFSYLTTISENDRKLVDRVREEAEQVRAIHEQVDSLKQTQAIDLDGMKQRRSGLQARIDADLKNIDQSTALLIQAQAREKEEEDRRLAEEAAQPPSTGDQDAPSSSVVVGESPPANLQPTGVLLRGVASWYGPGFNGNRTANGERYNMYAYTAAHKSLPFGTWLKVTHNGRSVFVRINDRGPYVGDRILDLSYSGAQAVGISGIGYVTAEIYR